MGYSGRYHAASLTAVFVALAVGILIGAALGSDVISGAADNLEKSLKSDLNDSRAEVTSLQGQLNDERSFEKLVYPAIVSGRLQREKVALVGLGDLPDAVKNGVQSAIDPSGARLSEVSVIREPPDVSSLLATIPRYRNKRVTRADRLDLAALKAGRALVGRGDLGLFRDSLLARFSGSSRSIDAVVVARYPPADLSPREAAATTALEDSLIKGLRSTGVNVVGVELSDDETSSVGYYSDQGLASVDDIDRLAGMVALVATLAGAEGSFGVKSTADSLLPDLIPGSANSGGGG